MTIEERLSKIEKDIENFRLAKDVVQTESFRRRLLQEIISAGTVSTATTSDMNELVSAVPATVAKDFPKKVRVNIDGTFYYIGLQDV